MRNSLGWALLAAGLVVLVFGFRSADSIGSSFSRLFTGAPTDKAIWLLAGGTVMAALGVGLLSQRGD